MTWHIHLKITQPQKNYPNPNKKKKPPKLKWTHPTQIRCTMLMYLTIPAEYLLKIMVLWDWDMGREICHWSHSYAFLLYVIWILRYMRHCFLKYRSAMITIVWPLRIVRKKVYNYQFLYYNTWYYSFPPSFG